MVVMISDGEFVLLDSSRMVLARLYNWDNSSSSSLTAGFCFQEVLSGDMVSGLMTHT
jgi:hypothetical protein